MPRYVQFQNKPINVSPCGRVIDDDKRVYDKNKGVDGRYFITHNGNHFYVDELVMQCWGDPTRNECRPLGEDEYVHYEGDDVDKRNPCIDDISYRKRSSKGGKYDEITDEMKEEILDLLEGHTYEEVKQIIEDEYDFKLSDYMIKKVKDQFLEVG